MKREEELFEQARALTSADAREGFLLEACGGDRELRRRVEELLAAHQEAGVLEFLDADGPTNKADPAQPEHRTSERPGDRIGRYKLLERIGEGGCGVVYVAEQEEPVQRRVALKVIKLGMDTRSVIARFEAERQALALMDHPNIAKVFDAGATETGRPYFVMELVRGIRITDYCDQKDLATIERLELFIQVCHAIQHAHQKGIIHRDIKPSNILVTRHDGVPVPKVIDFGIAKATGQQRLTDKTLYTALEQVIGTPAYMSPEQVDMSRLDIDTRSDIYSLGVLLYELLTGKTPFESKTLLAAGLDEMRRIIREQEPARPSTRLSKLAHAEQTTTAQRRQTEPPRLIRMLQGDLDWIAMKCLEKDRRRRYETANGLALDIKRHLDHEPVIARPPSAVYRMQKFARRNRLMVTAGAAVATALVLGVVVSTRLAIRATRAEVRAEAALHTMDFDAVNRFLASDGSADALALLARLLRQDPQDEVAAACLLNTLTTRSFCLPSMEPLLHDTKVSHARFSPDGAMVLTASGDHTVRLWDRLPTEAEWEKAARGGVEGRRFPWSDSDTIQHSRANYRSFADSVYDTSPTRNYHPTFATGATPYTSSVGSFAPNGYGLYDMAGNVWEWCWDWYSGTYFGSSPVADPSGPASGSYRVIRGGSWNFNAIGCRVANRYDYWPNGRGNNGGFRSVLPPGQP